LPLRWRTSALDGEVDRRARDLEQLGKIERGVLAAAPEAGVNLSCTTAARASATGIPGPAFFSDSRSSSGTLSRKPFDERAGCGCL